MKQPVVLNAWNFQACREETFGPLGADREPSADDLHWIRVWMQEALKPGSQTAQLYRVLEVDLDVDILRAAPAFRSSEHFAGYESSYALRMFWRVLFRRCAVGHAWQLGRFLKADESFPWRVWRAKEYLMPRLFVGILLGFLILLASSGMIDILQHLQYTPRWYLAPALFLLFVVALAFANVQRQIGRASGVSLFGRSLVLTVYGIVYASAGAAIHYWGAPRLGYVVTGPFVCLCAASAMLLGFVFQLFWQEQALGDPL